MGLAGTSRFSSLSMAPRPAAQVPQPQQTAPQMNQASAMPAPHTSPGMPAPSGASYGLGGSQLGGQPMGLGGGVARGATQGNFGGANAYSGVGNSPGNRGGVDTGGQGPAQNYVQQAGGMPGGDLASIQAEMARRNVGAQLNANPQNSALAGYMMG